MAYYRCLFSGQRAPQAQAPSPSEGRQLDGDGEWSDAGPKSIFIVTGIIFYTLIQTQRHSQSPFGQLKWD